VYFSKYEIKIGYDFTPLTEENVGE